VEGEWGEGVGFGVLLPEADVGLGDAGEFRVELDAFDALERELAGEQHGAALAGADVQEDSLFNGLGSGAMQPDVEQAVEDGGRDAVVGGELGDLGVCSLCDDFTGDQAGGVGAGLGRGTLLDDSCGLAKA
jgi:hypothetical protein